MDETFQRLLASLWFYPAGPFRVLHQSRSWPQAEAPSPPPTLNANQENFCVQFTDNGQIIFPESEYQIFSYSNPPLRGFTGQDPVALVAPFWDDADFSRQGTTFYQVGLSKLSIQGPPAASKDRQRAVWRALQVLLLSEPRLSVGRD